MSAATNEGDASLQPTKRARASRGWCRHVVGLSSPTRPRFRDDAGTARNDAFDRLAGLRALLQRLLRDALMRFEGRSVFASVRVRRHESKRRFSATSSKACRLTHLLVQGSRYLLVKVSECSFTSIVASQPEGVLGYARISLNGGGSSLSGIPCCPVLTGRNIISAESYHLSLRSGLLSPLASRFAPVPCPTRRILSSPGNCKWCKAP